MKLKIIKKARGGRDSSGQISLRHRGGEHKRFLRLIDDRRKFHDIKAKVLSIEYDPNRSSRLALISYQNGYKSYILASSNLKVGDTIITSTVAPIKDGNRLPLNKIPVGIPINSLEYQPLSKNQIVKSAGTAAYIQNIEGSMAQVKLPSGEIRLFPAVSWATIGQVGNVDHFNIKLKKAGDSRHRGIRPTVRGVAQNPRSHPHGGGEGRSSIGMDPKTPWGRPAMGKKTRKSNKTSSRLIVSRRH